MSADRESVRLSLRLLTAARMIERRVDQMFRAEFAATISRFDFLSALDRHGPLTLGEISAKLLVSNGNVTGLAARLRADGLIDIRAPRADRRVQEAALTAQGARLFARMAEAHAALVQELLRHLSPSDRRQLMTLLDAAKQSIGRTLEQENAA